MATSSVSDDTFQSEVLGASEPVVVDFWAEWCGPCKQIAPALEEIAAEMDGKVKFTKMNVDENPKTPVEFGIQTIPTLILFRNGEVVARQRGSMPKSKILAWVNEAIAEQGADAPQA